jgi:hypothetical protein
MGRIFTAERSHIIIDSFSLHYMSIKSKLLRAYDKFLAFSFANIAEHQRVYYHLDKIAAKESAEYIYQNLRHAVFFNKKKDLWEDALDKILPNGLILEFGVFRADSINHFAKYLDKKKDNRTLHGFDSFEGLSEAWSGTSYNKAHFDQAGKLPKVQNRVKLHKGWIDTTLPEFLVNEKESSIAFIHFDMDTYTPTKQALEICTPYLKVGTILVFDEFIGYPGWKEHEFKAFQEVITPSWEFEHISFCELRFPGRQLSKNIRVGIRLTKKI